MANTYHAGQKRRVERVGNQLDFSITNSTVNKVLHVAEDRKTLVRAIIDLTLCPVNPGDLTLVMCREPQGTAVIAPATGESLDINMVKEELWTHATRVITGQTEPMKVEVDLKSMRKLDVGDELVIRTLSNAADAAQCVGRITLFFKE